MITRYSRQSNAARTFLFCILAFSALALSNPRAAYGGNIYLTGHDILQHEGQLGYDLVILDFLRDAGLTGEIAESNYSISVIGSDVGFWIFSNLENFAPGYQSTTFFSTEDLDGNPNLQDAALSADCVIILSHATCGGCDLTDTGSAVINLQMRDRIITRFNNGMDLWVNSGANLTTYYDFLPSDFAVSAPAISGTQFCATSAGVAMGIETAMTGETGAGFRTHNHFMNFDATKLTVTETTCNGEQVISLAGRGVSLGTVPAVSTWGMMILALVLLTLAKLRFRTELEYGPGYSTVA